MNDSIIPDEDTPDNLDDASLSPEEYMNKQFGRGAWAYDPADDLFIVPDPDYEGPGRGFLLIDRARRRKTAKIPTNFIN